MLQTLYTVNDKCLIQSDNLQWMENLQGRQAKTIWKQALKMQRTFYLETLGNKICIFM